MDRRGYSNNSRQQFHTVSRSDRATSWRAGRSSNNENAVDNNNLEMSTKNNMINKNEGIESWWNTIPNNNRYALYPRSTTTNVTPNNQREQQGYQLFAPFTPTNLNYPPPPGLTTVLPQTPIHTPLLSQRIDNNRFATNNKNNNNENLLSFCQRSNTTTDHPLQQQQQQQQQHRSNIMSNNIYQQQQQQQTWTPLRDISTNTRQGLFININNSKQKKTKFPDPIGPPPATRRPLSWSNVVSRGVIDNEQQQSSSESSTFNNLDEQQQHHEDFVVVQQQEQHHAATAAAEDQIIRHGGGGPVTGTRYLSDSSVGFMMHNNNMFSNSPQQRPYTVIKIKNIPWSISTDDITDILRRSHDITIPSDVELPQSMHIVMDTKTGKTCGVAYAEIELLHSNHRTLFNTLDNLSTVPLQGRRLHFSLSSYDELRNNLFESWNGEFKNNVAIPYYCDTTHGDPVIVHQGGERSALRTGDSRYFISQKELQSLLNICRNYKVFYNRKCPERSFEYLMSIIINIPWLQTRTVTTIQRDIIYECYKLATDALCNHTSKHFHAIDNSLLPRLVRTALLCDGFTVKQKTGILNNAQIPCPDDLQKYIQEPTPPPETPTFSNPTIGDFMMDMMEFDD